MATQLSDIESMLEAEGLTFQPRDERTLGLGFATDQYRDALGEAGLFVVIELSEGGEYLKIYAPNAFEAAGPYGDVFLRACAMVQWKTKLVQFEFDSSDGEVRPIVEFPLEDAQLTQRQLMRCVHGLVAILDEYYPVLHQALKEGKIEFPNDNDRQVEALTELLSSVPPEILAEALIKADERRRTHE